MNCPIDNTQLAMSDRNGIEIDYCPSCRGVWLDRGELDKIIERDMSLKTEPNHFRQGEQPGTSAPSYDNKSHEYKHTDQRGKKRKESFLGDLFDF